MALIHTTTSSLGRMIEAIARSRQTLEPLNIATPVESIDAPRGTVLLKREDCSPIRSYKWRGAFNCMHALNERSRSASHVVAASAGNHAQGVALAASHLKMDATIYMPFSTPRIKRDAVARIGGSHVSIILHGDRFSETTDAAAEFARSQSAAFISAYDDIAVIAGQGTIGCEIIESDAPFDTVYLPIGGGGLASGVACVLRCFRPDVRIVGVEVEGQDAMTRSIAAGRRIHIEDISTFCDGTAVQTPGRHTFAMCSQLLDETITVSEDEVCAAIALLWERMRVVPEPSGAIGLAGAMRGMERDPNQQPLSIITGANMDFTTLGRIARRAGVGRHVRKHFRVHIDERAGALVEVLDAMADRANIVEFQYGKIDHQRAQPIIGFEVHDAAIDDLQTAIDALPMHIEDVTGAQTVDFRMIPFRAELCSKPMFVTIDFPDRPGALHELMRAVSDIASICYFNYRSTGELNGRALMGFEFTRADGAELFTQRTATLPLRIAPLDHAEAPVIQRAASTRPHQSVSHVTPI